METIHAVFSMNLSSDKATGECWPLVCGISTVIISCNLNNKSIYTSSSNLFKLNPTLSEYNWKMALESCEILAHIALIGSSVKSAFMN